MIVDTTAPSSAVTLPQLVVLNARRWGDRTAMREKDLGIWQRYSWRDYAIGVELIAHGLRSLGVEPGDRMAIIGDNRPRLYWACIAVQLA